MSAPGPINRRWLPLNALRAFDAVGERLSFTAGARALTVTQSAMSRHVSALEQLIGKPLFDRGGAAGLRLTPAGEALLPVVRRSLDRMEQALNSIRDKDGAARPLRVHMPPSLLHQLALPILHGFRGEHPEISIDISSANGTGLPPTDVDLGIIFDRPGVDDTVTDLLWMVRVAPLCSPAMAAAHGHQPIEAFLADAELLHVKLEGQPRGLLWSAWAERQGIAIDTDRGLAFDTAVAAGRYAMAGAGGGVMLADIDMFHAELADGRLVMPYDRVSADGFGYYLKTHAEDLADPAIYLLREWVIRHFASDEWRSGSDKR